MKEAGVCIVASQRDGLMHHKFAIVDSTLLLNGSFNWTERAVSENCENVVISRWANQFVIFCETLNSNFPGRGHWWISFWTSLRKCLQQMFASVLCNHRTNYQLKGLRSHGDVFMLRKLIDFVNIKCMFAKYIIQAKKPA